ncbi:MAG: DUF1801 domain-containing protein [Devosia sp.]
MAETKTKQTDVPVEEFISRIEDPRKRADSHVLIDMMRKISGAEPEMWGPTIIGFGFCHYVYDSGREGDTALAAFSPRAAELSIYLAGHYPEIKDKHEALLAKLGKHRSGKSCLYVKRLEDVDIKVLEKLVKLSFDATVKRYPASVSKLSRA